MAPAGEVGLTSLRFLAGAKSGRLPCVTQPSIVVENIRPVSAGIALASS